MNQFYLHASAVNVNNKAILFLGHSTSGKSTISELMSEKYRRIADDVVWVRCLANEKYAVTDGKHREISDSLILRDEYLKNTKTQNQEDLIIVSNIARLFKSDSTFANRISQRQLCRYLSDALFEVDIQWQNKDIEFRKKLFASVAEMARKICGCDLHFSLSSEPEQILDALAVKRG